MKMVISDKGYDMTIYLNGKNYEKFSRTFKKYKVYMLSLVKNCKNGYINVMAATEPENVDVDKRIAAVHIWIDGINEMKLAKSYINANMFKNNAKDLYYLHGRQSNKAQYQITICNDDIIFLEDNGCKVEIIKND
jgi:hypothetical protein